MTTAAIRKKLHDYINIADDQKVKAIYTMVESEMLEKTEVKKLSRADKIDSMKDASSDPLFLADLNEVMDDFKVIDNENI